MAAGAPLVAADDPEGAVEAVLEAVTSRQLDDLDGLVCSAQQEAIQGAFSDAGLGIGLMEQDFDTTRVSVEGLETELISTAAGEAEVQVRGTLVIDVDEDEMRELVRELIEAGTGPDEPPVGDDDIDEALPLMGDLLGLEQPIDDIVTIALEAGEWVVCGSLSTDRAGSDAAYETSPIVATEGLCGLATPAELSALSTLEYDSSTGFGEFCTYNQSDWDDYHSATLAVLFDTTLDQWREVYVPDAVLEVDGAPAFSSGANVLTQAGADVLQVTVSPPQREAPGDIDAVALATRISELFLPRLADLALAQATEAGPSLCDGLSLAELARASGRVFDQAQGDRVQCAWSSSSEDAGLDTIVATVTDLTLADFREILDPTEAGRVGGLLAIWTPTQAVVELTDGRTLDVSVYYDEDVTPVLPADELARVLAELLAPEVPPAAAAEATTIATGAGLLAGLDSVDDLALALPYAELSELAGVAFDDPGFCGDYCEYYVSDGADGFHFAVTSLESRPIAAWLEDYPEADSIEITGQPAVLATDVFPDLGASAVVIVAIPGYEELTLAAGIGVDTSADVEIDAVATAEAMAALALGRLIGTGD